MNMQHMTELMDQSFRRLKEIHDSDQEAKDLVLLELAENLLKKVEQRDQLIAEQRMTIERLTKELRNGREREGVAIS